MVIRALHADDVNKAFTSDFIVSAENVMYVLDDEVEVGSVGLVHDEIINLDPLEVLV